MKRVAGACVVFVLVLGVLAAAPAQAASLRDGRRAWCGTSLGGARNAVWAHAEAIGRRGEARAAAATADRDEGQIAVLEDQGDLVLVPNILDLQEAAIRFSPDGAGYSATRLSLPLAQGAASPVRLGDDDTRALPLPFAFPFYGTSYGEVHVNSDGNLTFGTGDAAATERNLGRLLSGPPRIAPLLADLDPTSGGSVTTSDLGDRFAVTWTAVPQFDKLDKNTFQVVLHPDGRIDFSYARELSGDIEEGAVGIAPGESRGGLTAVDFATALGVRGDGALGESFRTAVGLDSVAVARRFYASHPDDYDQLVIYTSKRVTAPGVFAYEQTVKNGDAGIGAALEDSAAAFGSAGRLQSVAVMSNIYNFPVDLNQRFLGADTALSVLAHEVGHRWLAQARFRDGARASSELLGRDNVHWSFFLDSDGSHLEGNDIEDQGGGRFRSVDAAVRYSPLDQYLMGVRPPEEVPPFFFVRSPLGISSDPTRDPEIGVSWSGVRKDVGIADVVAALGPRSPAAGPRAPFRQAFVFVAVGAAETDALGRVERIRAAFEPYFSRSTDGRLEAHSQLR